MEEQTLKISDRVITLTSHQDLDVWQIENTLNCISAIITALAMAFVMSSWEASNHSQSRSPVFAELSCDKRSCDEKWDPELRPVSSLAGPSQQGTKSREPGEPPVPPQPLAWAEGQLTLFLATVLRSFFLFLGTVRKSKMCVNVILLPLE